MFLPATKLTFAIISLENLIATTNALFSDNELDDVHGAGCVSGGYLYCFEKDALFPSPLHNELDDVHGGADVRCG
jgi:hypothetical protein